ncbi:MAG: hypothetical protein ACFB10_19185 [Salibacteraceae bacterium]
MSLTGGDLNALNGRFGISAPHRSVPIMQLIRVHRPRSKAELEALVAYHAHHTCSCGIVSRGTIQDFGKALYEAQHKAWGTYRYSLEHCIQWEYHLFITQSWKGSAQERNLLQQLRLSLPEFQFDYSAAELDAEYRIDLTINKKDRLLGGIQVKPESFQHMRPSVIEYQKRQHRKWELPVLAAVYQEDGRWLDFQGLVARIKQLE